ncbi:MAG: glycosyltransferase family 4 protein [Cytophagales bacterium]|nr:glycosyltransferase family 4 protein [Cytophagales bacterium]MDW8384883.1 glycosyltransferase family 4 protein [Flammeovirgaceae bacterium]
MKPHIIHITASLGIGGVEKVLLDILQQADVESFRVSVVVLSDNVEMLKRYTLSPQIDIHTLAYEFDKQYNLLSYLKASFLPSHTRKRAEEFLRLIKELKPDILHFHTLPRELMLGILAKKEIPTLELLCTDHLVRLAKDEYSPITRRLLGFAFANLCKRFHLAAVSKSVLQIMEEFGYQGKNKIVKLIENQIDIQKYNPDETKKSDIPTVVYVARLSAVKGHLDLLHAWKKVKYSAKKRLRLIGPADPDVAEQVQMFLTQNGQIEDIEVLGSRSDVIELLAQAHIAVFPSYKEGLPMALLEKMAMQLPVICSDIPELTDIIQHEYNGLVYPLGNTDELAACIDRLLQNPQECKRLGENARQTVIKRFGRASLASLYEDFYKEILLNSC